MKTKEEAIKIIKEMKLDNHKLYFKVKKLPPGLPKNPKEFYKDWSWVKVINNPNKRWEKSKFSDRWISFKQARTIARKLCKKEGIITYKQFLQNYQKKFRPLKIPRQPMSVYEKRGWISWFDFTGTKNMKGVYDHKYLSFKEARDYVRKLNLKGYQGWKDYVASGKKPKNIPSNVKCVYKNKFKDIGDWTGYKPYVRISYNQAKKILRKMNVNRRVLFWELCKSNKIPTYIPRNPDHYYARTGDWKGWSDFLNTGCIPTKGRTYMPFKEAREFARKHKVHGQDDWNRFSKENRKKLLKLKIPGNPSTVYKGKGWISWGDWLGNRNHSNIKKRSIQGIRYYFRSLNIETKKDWQEYKKTHEIPWDIPKDPESYLRERGKWIGWRELVGKENRFNFLPYEEAQKIVQERQIKSSIEYKKFVRMGKLPKGMPICPELVYAK